LFYNAGTLYSGIRNLILYHYAPEYTRVKTAFAYGTELG